jgi:hypothetical protein
MKKYRTYILSVILTGLICLHGRAQPDLSACKPDSTLTNQINTFFSKNIQDSINAQQTEQTLKAYLNKLNQTKSRKKTDLEFLRTVFFKTHRKFLKRYDASATFPQTMETGTYGCLSGTALYSMILSHFGYEYEIIEMASHVYLKARVNNQIVLIESTIPEGGFLEKAREINKLSEQYADNSRKLNSIIAIAGIDTDNGQDTYQKSISMTQLSGLQYYNMAIYDLKDGALEAAFANAAESVTLYPSKRTELLMEIVINKILQSRTLTKDLKSAILNTYVTQVKKKKLTQR